MDIQTFEKVTRDCHPAATDVLAFLDSLAVKDKQAFAASFGVHGEGQFFANLPGGVKVTRAKQLIDMHKEFLESSASRFRYGEINNGVGNAHFFMCSVPAHVTLPNGTQRDVCIDMTFFRNSAPLPAWIPCRLINTVVDPSQAVLSN
jgi:hypothetical protein